MKPRYQTIVKKIQNYFGGMYKKEPNKQITYTH